MAWNEAFPPASQATCHVDPEAPSESVLAQEYNGKYTSGCILGGVLLVLGALLTWVGVRWTTRGMTVAGNLMSSG